LVLPSASFFVPSQEETPTVVASTCSAHLVRRICASIVLDTRVQAR